MGCLVGKGLIKRLSSQSRLYKGGWKSKRVKFLVKIQTKNQLYWNYLKSDCGATLGGFMVFIYSWFSLTLYLPENFNNQFLRFQISLKFKNE